VTAPHGESWEVFATHKDAEAETTDEVEEYGCCSR
jgi:hypothetical protein